MAATMDIATLDIRVNTAQVREGAAGLEELAHSARLAETAVRAHATATEAHSAALERGLRRTGALSGGWKSLGASSRAWLTGVEKTARTMESVGDAMVRVRTLHDAVLTGEAAWGRMQETRLKFEDAYARRLGGTSQAAVEAVEQQFAAYSAAYNEDAAAQIRIETLKQDALCRLRTDALSGLQTAWTDWQVKMRDGAAVAGRLFGAYATGLEDALTEPLASFLERGKASCNGFRHLFHAMLADLARYALARPVTVSIAGSVVGLLGTAGTAAADSTASSSAGSALSSLTGGNNLTSLPVGSLLPDSWTSGISGIMGTALPGTAYEVAIASTPGLSSTASLAAAQQGATYTAGGLGLGSAMGYGALGGLGYSTLGSVVGLPQNGHTGLTASLGATLGAWGGSALASSALLAGTGMAAGAAFGSVIPVVGTIVGAVAGGLLGSLFGGWEDEPEPRGRLRLMGELGQGADWFLKKGNGVDTGGMKLWTQDGFDFNPFVNALQEPITTLFEGYDAFIESIPERFRKQVSETASKYEISVNSGDHRIEDWNEDTLTDKILKPLQNKITEGILSGFSSLDMSGLVRDYAGNMVTGRDGILGALVAGFSYMNLASGLPNQEYAEEFQAIIGEKLVDAFAAVDLSGIPLDVDKSSWQGLYAAAEAITYWKNLTDVLDAAIHPLGELETQAKSVMATLESWKISLERLGFSEEAYAEIENYRLHSIAEITDALREQVFPATELATALESVGVTFDDARSALEELGATTEDLTQLDALRLATMIKQTAAITQAISDDLALRGAALTLSEEEYQIRSLEMQQREALADVISKVGRESELYTQTLRVQAAEMASLRAEQAKTLLDSLQSQRDSLQSEYDNARQTALSEDISALDAAVNGWRSAVESLTDARNGLWTGDGNTDLFSREASAQAEFDRLYKAAMGGDADAALQLGGAGQDWLSLVQQLSPTASGYQDAFYGVDEKLKNVAAFGETQISVDEQQLDILQAQYDAMQGTDRTLTDILSELQSVSAEVVKAQGQYDAALAHLDSSVKEVTTYTQLDNILRAKMDALNAGIMSTRTDWTSEEVREAMRLGGMDVTQWLEKYGGAEGFSVIEKSGFAKELTLKAADWSAEIGEVKDEIAILQEIQANGLTYAQWFETFGQFEDWYTSAIRSGSITTATAPVTVTSSAALNAQQTVASSNTNPAAAATTVTSPTGAWNDPYTGYTGVYGSHYASEGALIRAKADAMNAGRTLAEGQSAGGWTPNKVSAAIAADGLTVSEWYSRYGKAEGFARGGLTPANTPFLTGENGPELVMSPQQWRVVSNPESARLLSLSAAGSDGHSREELRALREELVALRRDSAVKDRKIEQLGVYLKGIYMAVTDAEENGWKMQEATA